MSDTTHKTELWDSSPDAVPAGHTQITIYNEETGERVATVFEKNAVPLIVAAPQLRDALLETQSALEEAISALKKGWPEYGTDEMKSALKASYSALNSISS